MAEAYYEPTPATDGATMNPVPGAVFQVFELADTTFSTPLSLRVGSGNPTTTVTASSTLATLPGVYVTSPNFEHIWKSGTFEWRRDSIDGAKKAVEDAKIAASNSANSAAASEQSAKDAAALVNAPADTIMRDLAANPDSAFGGYQNTTYARSKTKLTVAYLGDSQVPSSTYVYGSMVHWAGVARSMLGHKYDDGVQAGVGGQTSTQIAARVGDVTSSQPSICVFDAGVNDLAAGTPASTIIANIQTIIDALVKAGIKPVVLTALPSTNIETKAKLTECTRLNDWIKALPATQGVYVIDWRPGVVDFTSTAAPWKAGLSSDGVHPNDVGHTVLGRIVGTALAPLINAPSPLLSDAGANTSLLSLNPGMTGSGGVAGVGVTGTVPASWDVGPVGSTTTASSVEARTDDIGGNWLKLDVTAGTLRVFQQNTAAGVDWAVGDTVWAETEIYISNTPTNFRGVALRLEFWNALGNVADAVLMQATGVVSPVVGSANKYVLRTKKGVIPASTARLQMFVDLNSAGVPNYTVRIGRTAIRKQI